MARSRDPKWLKAARKGTAPGQGTWLARALGKAGAIPGGQVERAIHSGRVTVNGALARDPLHPLKEGDEVRFDGAPVSLATRTRVVLFHKPAGSVVAAKDPERNLTVFDQLLPQLPPELSRYVWHAIGRLDRQTTGALLFTNDEEVVERVTSPESKLEKRYVARVEGRPDDAQLEPLRHGVTIDEVQTAPAQARVLVPGVVEIILTEGRHHQVRRMLNAVGLPVLALHREAVGGILCDVPEGGFRELTAEELRHGLGVVAPQQR